MSHQPKEQSRAELNSARTLNTVAQVGAAHAMVASLPKGAKRHVPGLLSAEERAKKIGRSIPGGRRLGAAVRRVPGGGRALAIAPVAGWEAFHGAEWAGDLMARRSINNQIRAKEAAVTKSYSIGVEQANGHGRRIVEDVSKGIVTGGLKRGIQGGKAISHLPEERAAVAAGRAVRGAERVATSRATPIVAGTVGGAVGGGVLARRKKSEAAVGKARRFDPEADRQRRLGTYAGLAGGGAIVAGDQLRHEVKGSLKSNGTRGPYIGYKRGRGKRGLILTGTTAGLAALSGGALARGVSERNRTWT